MSFYTIERPVKPAIQLPILEFEIKRGIFANFSGTSITLKSAVYNQWLAHLRILLPDLAFTHFTIESSKAKGAESHVWLLHLYNGESIIQTLFLKILNPKLSSVSYVPIIAAMQNEVTHSIIPVLAANDRLILMHNAPVPSLDEYRKELQVKSVTIANVIQCSLLLLQAICRVHELHMVHLDVKPQNVLCTKIPTFIDFSTAEYVSNLAAVNRYMCDNTCFKGTPMFTSPDHMNGNLHLKSDVFSAAQSILFLTRGYTLSCYAGDKVIAIDDRLKTLKEMNQEEIHVNVRRAIQGFYKPLADVLCEMTYIDIERRLTAQTALQEFERIAQKNNDQ